MSIRNRFYILTVYLDEYRQLGVIKSYSKKALEIAMPGKTTDKTTIS